MRTVAVIGAGPCGLVACKTLAEGDFDVECFEAGDRVGGVWNVDLQPSGAYRSLHTNTSTRAMAFTGFPFADDFETYPAASEMQRYFEAYAEHFGLYERIRFGQRVNSAVPVEGGGWRLELEGASEPREFDALVVASGQYVKPRWPSPEPPGQFSGEQMHVFDYFDPVTPIDCRGKRVVVVGLGSSAAELAAELCDPDSAIGCAESVILSARSGRWVIPKMVDGTPIDYNAAHPAEVLPEQLKPMSPEQREAVVKSVLGPVFRGLADKGGAFDGLGLPEPTIEPWEERPTMSMEFIPALQAGRIDVRPGIARFEGDRIEFSDGSSAEADVIVYATGYEPAFPFLSREALGCAAPDLALYRQIVHPDHGDLFFVGCLRVGCSMWPLAEQQAVWISRVVAGQVSLPPPEERRRTAMSLMRSEPVLCSLYAEALREDVAGD